MDENGILITAKVPFGCHNAKGLEFEAQRRLYRAVALLFPQVGHCSMTVSVNRDERPRHLPRVTCEIDSMPPAFHQAHLLDLLVGTVLYHLVVLAGEYQTPYTTIRVEAQDGPYKQALGVWHNPLSGETGETDAAVLPPRVFIEMIEQAQRDVGADGPDADDLAEQHSHFTAALSLAGALHHGTGG